MNEIGIIGIITVFLEGVVTLIAVWKLSRSISTGKAQANIEHNTEHVKMKKDIEALQAKISTIEAKQTILENDTYDKFDKIRDILDEKFGDLYDKIDKRIENEIKKYQLGEK